MNDLSTNADSQKWLKFSDAEKAVASAREIEEDGLMVPIMTKSLALI